jgi:Fe-S-cluster-containing dehydrogenase component/DMSO reductase anchor subunit
MTTTALSDTRTLIDELLAEQQRLTAVERFAVRDEAALPAAQRVYRDLLPARGPSEGEQYAFSVDLDTCSGCKACVTACHNLNGLDEEETWRSVGLLHGIAGENGFQQTVTTACHHCVDPACMNGCPVLAYEKDPRTGIVHHLDDQCIGCQYCILKCPYDVPKYSAKRGIVRKCDMCANRLAVNEAPACVQACPNGAIAITVVNQAAVTAAASEGVFLPGTPDPAYTQPTTQYHSRRGLPHHLLSADACFLRPSPAHPALVVMLVLTQLSVGAFCLERLLSLIFSTNLMMQLSAFHSLVALVIGVLALGTSTLHLGRPLGAWRAIIGLRTSWLSREILAFALFAGLATLEAAIIWFKPQQAVESSWLATMVALSGLAGVFCSLMIYQDTRRPFWSGRRVALRFFGTTFVLGTATVLFVTTLQGLLSPAVATQGSYEQLTSFLTVSLAAGCLAKLGMEALVFRHLRQPGLFSLEQTARLMSGELVEITTARFLLGLVGGVLLPLAFLVQRPSPGPATLGVTAGVMLFTALGELLERHLFFVAVAPTGMPGGFDS